MIKKIIFTFMMIIGLNFIVSCSEKPETFKGIGMSIELDNSFVEKEVIQAPFYLESKKHIFLGLRENKSDVYNQDVLTLEQYYWAVLNENNKYALMNEYNEHGLRYYYGYYQTTINEQSFGYMLFVMVNDNYFYSFNFATLSKNLESSKEQYHDWIKTITFD